MMMRATADRNPAAIYDEKFVPARGASRWL